MAAPVILIVGFGVATAAQTYANGNAKSKSFLRKIVLSKNSRKCPPTAAVGKKKF